MYTLSPIEYSEYILNSATIKYICPFDKNLLSWAHLAVRDKLMIIMLFRHYFLTAPLEVGSSPSLTILYPCTG